MACAPPRCATCNGRRSNCPRAACTFTVSRTESPVCIQSAVTRCGLCVSCDAITPKTPTYSFPSAAGQSAALDSIGSSSASGGAAKMPFPIHPHMLRHACGFKLANDGHDTRALQHYLGHRNIQHTIRYTEMAPDRFKDFWRD